MKITKSKKFPKIDGRLKKGIDNKKR